MKIYDVSKWETEGIIEVDSAEDDCSYPNSKCWVKDLGDGVRFKERAYSGFWFESLEDAKRDVKRRRRNLIQKTKRKLDRLKSMNIDNIDIEKVENYKKE